MSDFKNTKIKEILKQGNNTHYMILKKEPTEYSGDYGFLKKYYIKENIGISPLEKVEDVKLIFKHGLQAIKFKKLNIKNDLFYSRIEHVSTEAGLLTAKIHLITLLFIEYKKLLDKKKKELKTLRFSFSNKTKKQMIKSEISSIEVLISNFNSALDSYLSSDNSALFEKIIEDFNIDIVPLDMDADALVKAPMPIDSDYVYLFNIENQKIIKGKLTAIQIMSFYDTYTNEEQPSISDVEILYKLYSGKEEFHFFINNESYKGGCTNVLIKNENFYIFKNKDEVLAFLDTRKEALVKENNLL